MNIIRTWIRRIICIPLFVAWFPILYMIGWLYSGHKAGIEFASFPIIMAWHGME